MKPDRTSFEKAVHRHLTLFGSPSVSQVEASRLRIHERLRAHYEAAQSGAPPVRAAGLRYAWRVGLSLAAAAAVIVIVATVSFQRGDWLATVEAADGSTYTLEPNELLRASAGDGAMLKLLDGSSVEMRAASELSVERAADGLRIRLLHGDIIVNAATQRDGHLYVQTKDMTVAVVGTVFLMNAGQDGSRVAVIEGEVRVREGDVETRLRPGEQVATSAAIGRRPVTEDITWSRNASAHLAILESFTKGMAQTAGTLSPVAAPGQSAAVAGQAASSEFEEASIRECDPDNLPPLPAGARGGGANSFYMTPGRTYALCMTLATLIRTAYGYGPMDLDYWRPEGARGFGPDGRGMNVNIAYGLGVEDGRRVRGAPDWVLSERYTIEAVAGGSPNAETMRGPMLQALLVNRFRLKAHIETEQAPAFTLKVARGGIKIKLAESGACDPMPPADVSAIPRRFDAVRRGEKPSCGFSSQPNGPNHVVVAGDVALSTLAQWLGGPLGDLRVTDQTGLTDKYNFVLEFVWDGNTPGRRRVLPPPGDHSGIAPAPTIYVALEEQLGLSLEPAKASREFIVIDGVERPSPN